MRYMVVIEEGPASFGPMSLIFQPTGLAFRADPAE